MSQYQARLAVSRHRDPYAGIPEVIPSPASPQRLEDFTIQQLIREQVILLEAQRRGIVVSDRALDERIKSLRDHAGGQTFEAALDRNGFTVGSFREYQRVLLTEVQLVDAMAKPRIQSAFNDLKSGQPFAAVAAKWSDDAGTSGRGGDAGWLRPADIPEPPLSAAVESLSVGAVTDIVQTDRGYTIATILGQRGEEVHLADIVVLAPEVDLFSPQATPPWFTKLIGDQLSSLEREGKITVNVGSHGRQ
jgi:parvulin-like peptidyl-prolyl isomerase